MFDIGWTEMLVIAIVMIVVVGPKDLPRMLRTFGKTTAKLRSMAGDFQKQFNEALKEAELDDVKKSVDQLRSLDPRSEIKKQLNPFEKAAQDVRAGLDSLKQPSAKPAEPAKPEAAEPLKNGATVMPGVEGPTAMPAAPAFPAMADPAPAAATEGLVKAPAATSAKAAKAAPVKAKAAPKSAARTTAKPAPAKPAAKAAPAGKIAAKAPAKAKAPATARKKAGTAS
jgi:sec-independent protein translocase protein TatB